MTSYSAPLVIGLAAAATVLMLIALISATRRIVRRRRRQHAKWESETEEEWRYRPRAPGEEQSQLPSMIADVQESDQPIEPDPPASVVAEAVTVEELGIAADETSDALRRESELEAARIIEDARRQAEELLDNAALEARAIVGLAGRERTQDENEHEHAVLEEQRPRLDSLATQNVEGHPQEVALTTEQGRSMFELLEEMRLQLASLTAIYEAAQKAVEAVVTTEQPREDLRRGSEAESQRHAAEITEEARRQARELLEEARSEAASIVGDAGRERVRLLEELARQRSAFEDARTSLAGFLDAVHDEVEHAQDPATVRSPDEALEIKSEP